MFSFKSSVPPCCQSKQLCHHHLFPISSHKLASFHLLCILFMHFIAKLNFILLHAFPSYLSCIFTTCPEYFSFCVLINFSLLLDSLPTAVLHFSLSSCGQHGFLHPSLSPLKFFLKCSCLSPPKA